MTDNPTNKVHLDLDTWEREGAVEPFSIRLSGRVFTFMDSEEMDWQVLADVQEDPKQFFRLALPGGDADAFFGSTMSLAKLKHLMKCYKKHYGITDPGEASASPA